jgi:hypothetical protein
MAEATVEGDGVICALRFHINVRIEQEYLVLVEAKRRANGEIVLCLVGRVDDHGLHIWLEPAESERGET